MPNRRLALAHSRTVIPGMIDAHVHVLNLGNSLRNVDLVLTRIATYLGGRAVYQKPIQ